MFLSVFATTLAGENKFRIIRHSDNTIDLRFHLFQITKNRKPEINTLYVEIVEILRQKTNFQSLENQEQYLIALARMLEAAVFQGDIRNIEGQKILKLTELLRIEEDPLIISGQKGGKKENLYSCSSQHRDTKNTNEDRSHCRKRTCPLLEYSKRQVCPIQACNTVPHSGTPTPQALGSDGG